MRILQSWLHQYIRYSFSPESLAEKLTMLGLEFESIERLWQKYDGFVVGRVIRCERHPQADRLTVCTVDTGNEHLTIVCGGPNVAEGQKVAVGLVGATVPKNQHDSDGAPFVLGKVNIRGVESSGMICSAYELDLGSDAEGILVLDEQAKVGQPLANYLGLNDVAFDIEITPNRPDWLSHLGVAREIGVLVHRQPKLPVVKLNEGKERIDRYLSVTVQDRVNCPRFAARMIRGVRIGPSPLWLQTAIRNVGLRPRNNVVDVTNYVMLELGQPLHAFDYALLRGGRIIVRQAKAGAPFTTLDGKQHALPEGTVMVCDAEREVSIAGVMGGENSEINDETVDVVLESAYWNPSSIRRTSRTLGISTDASQRFERGGDPNGVMIALDRAADLVSRLAGGTLLKGAIDVYPRKIRERIVPMRPSRANKVLGTHLTQQEMVRFLRLLGVHSLGKKGNAIRFRVPTYRVDLEREIDLIEEVARVFGYDRIEDKTSATVDFVQPFPRSGVEDRVRFELIGRGFNEAITNSMQDAYRASLGGMEAVTLLNPLSQDMSAMRTTLVPGLLGVVAKNQSYGNESLRLFEIGHVFGVDHSGKKTLVDNYIEEDRVCLLLAGLAEKPHWQRPVRKVDFFDIKGEVESFLWKIALDKWRFISYSTSDGLTDTALAIEIHGSYAGYLGRVSSEVLKTLDVEGEVFFAELALSPLAQYAGKKFEPLPRFPRVRRDVAFFVDGSVSVERLEASIRKAAGELLSAVEVFDVYQGDVVAQGKKSVAFALELMSREKTLTDAEIDAAIRRIAEAVASECGGTLRSQRTA